MALDFSKIKTAIEKALDDLTTLEVATLTNPAKVSIDLTAGSSGDIFTSNQAKPHPGRSGGLHPLRPERRRGKLCEQKRRSGRPGRQARSDGRIGPRNAKGPF